MMPRKLNLSDSYFGKRLAKIRKQKGLTQAQLGDVIGVSQRVIAYYESETDHIPANLLMKISESLHVSADTLLGIDIPREDNRTFDARFMKKWGRLSPQNKKAVSKIIDTLLAQS